MLKSLTFFALAIIITGCSKTYTPTDNMLQIKQNTTRQLASEIASKYFTYVRKDIGKIGGIWINNESFINDKPLITVTQEGYSYLGCYKELISSRTVSVNYDYKTIENTYQEKCYQKVKNFKDIKNIWPPNRGGTRAQFILFSIENTFIEVSPEEIDELLAALTILAPQAKLITY